MIKIDDELNIIKDKEDKGYIKILTDDYIPKNGDIATFVITDEQDNKIMSVNSFDFDEQGFYFTVFDKLGKGNYIYYVLLETIDFCKQKIFQNRRYTVE